MSTTTITHYPKQSTQTMGYKATITPNQIEEQREITGAFGSKQETKTHPIENPQLLKLRTDEGDIRLSSLFDRGITKITAEVGDGQQLLYKVDDESQQKTITGNSDGPPAPPRITVDEIEGSEKRRYYEWLFNEDETQPKAIRRLIYQRGSLTKGELKELAQAEGYGPKSSGLGTSLRMLEKVTGEIEREGRGDSETIEWVGEE